jgi:hypothetical protein
MRKLPGKFLALVMVVFLALVVVMPRAAVAEPRDKDGGGQGVLHKYARDTWRSFEAMTSSSGLPADNLCRSASGGWVNSAYTSPTNIGAYIWSTLAAEDLHIIKHSEATQRLAQTLATVSRLETSHGFYFNWYDPQTGARLTTWPVNGNPVRPYLSSVDNGWLAAALIMLRNARPELAPQANATLSHMDFAFFYDPYDPKRPYDSGLLWGGYYTDTNSYDFHYGMFNTEPRIASYIGIATGRIEPQHYYHMLRTLPPEWDWQEQRPEGVTRTYFGVQVFEGHYVYKGPGIQTKRLVPTWGGSMFEALMPALFVPEAEWAPKSWGVNHPLYVEAQIEHGLKEAQYGYWGFSPSNKPEGGYDAYGVDAIGTEPNGYPSNEDRTLVDYGYPGNPGRQTPIIPPPSAYTNGVVTPHASFLALQFAPREALENLKNIAKDFNAYGPYGFYDSVNVQTGKVSDCVLALDQGMIMAGIANALDNRSMQRYFSAGMVESVVRPLISPEEFTAGRE